MSCRVTAATFNWPSAGRISRSTMPLKEALDGGSVPLLDMLGDVAIEQVVDRRRGASGGHWPALASICSNTRHTDARPIFSARAILVGPSPSSLSCFTGRPTLGLDLGQILMAMHAPTRRRSQMHDGPSGIEGGLH
jgi:hypothetical protein